MCYSNTVFFFSGVCQKCGIFCLLCLQAAFMLHSLGGLSPTFHITRILNLSLRIADIRRCLLKMQDSFMLAYKYLTKDNDCSIYFIKLPLPFASFFQFPAHPATRHSLLLLACYPFMLDIGFSFNCRFTSKVYC